MYCPACGKQINDNSKFCRYCGTSIRNLENKDVPKENSTLSTKQQAYKSPKSSPAQHVDRKTGNIILITVGILVGIIVLIALIKLNDGKITALDEVKIIPPNYMEKGNEALTNKNYQQAISFFEKVSADSKDYQEAQNQIKYAQGMIIQSELDRYESSKDITGLDNFIQRHSGTEYEQKANDIRTRLMDYFHTRQSQFENKQIEFAKQYTEGMNDVARSNIFNESNRWSADFMKEDNYRFYDWHGTLLTLLTTKGGTDVGAIINSNNIAYKVKLTSSDPVYQKLASVQTFKPVRFSGVFKLGSNRLLSEGSITEMGKMLNPELNIQLTDISMD